MKNYDTNALLKNKFNETYNAINFLFVFKYMSDYVDVDKSSELSKFYTKDEFISQTLRMNISILNKLILDQIYMSIWSSKSKNIWISRISESGCWMRGLCF